MDAAVEDAYRSWPAMEAAYAAWRRCGRHEGIRDDTRRFLVEYAGQLHAMHLWEFKAALDANGAPLRIMMQRQMIAELEAELRKRDAPIWANALPGHAPTD